MRRLPVSLCAILLCAACSEPPQKEIDRAQGAIDAARAAGAERYAQTEFAAATTALQQAREAVEQRDYRLALSRAIDASERAQEAAKQAGNNKAAARSEADGAATATANSVQQLRSVLKAALAARVPAKQIAGARTTERQAEKTLQEARALIEGEQYAEASALLKEASRQIHEQIVLLNDAAQPKPQRRRR
jgi:hypothetical protein